MCEREGCGGDGAARWGRGVSERGGALAGLSGGVAPTSGARWQAGESGRAGLGSGERTGPGGWHCWLGRGGKGKRDGPAREEKKKRVGRLAEVVGRNGFWIFWVWVRFFYFLFSFLFLLQTKFEFKPHSNKSMHQHECNTKF